MALEDARGLHFAQAHVRAGRRRDCPREGPARAVEHRQGPQIAAVVVELEGQRVGKRAEIGAAVAVDGPLRVAGGAARVEQADRVPLVLGTRVDELRITRGDKALILDPTEARRIAGFGVGDVDHDRPGCAQRLERGRDGAVKLAVGQQQLGLAVVEGEGDQRRVEPDIDGIEYCADHRHGVVGLQHGGNIGGQDRHRVAAPDAGLGQGMCQPPRAGVQLAIREATVAVDHRRAVAEELRRALEEAHRAQRHEVGRALAQLGPLVRGVFLLQARPQFHAGPPHADCKDRRRLAPACAGFLVPSPAGRCSGPRCAASPINAGMAPALPPGRRHV